jgi:UDP-2,3-diacylglucosamine pyrophosphatase LpxH
MASGSPMRGGTISARTLFLSDIHLGFRHARASELNEFLSLGLLAQMLRGQFEVHPEWVHRTAGGERLLVLHGDQFDEAMVCPRWMSRLGDVLHGVMLSVNHGVNNVRCALGRPYWPLAEYLKLAEIGTSLRYIEQFEQFEQLAARHAARCGYDGIVCGHIHRANLRQFAGTLYCNTGDWVESCTPLIEGASGHSSCCAGRACAPSSCAPLARAGLTRRERQPQFRYDRRHYLRAGRRAGPETLTDGNR